METQSKTKRKFLSMRTTMIAAAFACVALLVVGRAGQANPPSEAWGTDFAKAKTTSANEKKPLLAMVSASWCPPCKLMKSDVLPKPAVVEALKTYVPVYIDSDEQPAVAQQLGVDALPTFIVIGPDGTEYGRVVGIGGINTPASFNATINGFVTFGKKIQEVDAKIAKDPKNPALLKEKGDLLSDSGKLEESAKAYREALKLDPDNKTGVKQDVAFFDILDKIDNGGDMTAGAKELAAFEEANPKSSRAQDAHFLRAMIALHLDNRAEGITLFKSYLDKYPKGRYAERIKAAIESLSEDAASTATASTVPATKPAE